MRERLQLHSEALERAIGHLSRVALSFAALSFYLLLTVGAMDDTSLLSRGSMVHLPVFGVSVSTTAFSVVAPLLLVSLHLYLLLERYMLARRLRALGGGWVSAPVYMPSFLFQGYQGGTIAGRWDRGIRWLAGAAFGFMVVLPIVVMLILEFRFMAYHAPGRSWFQFSILVFDVLVAMYLLSATRGELVAGIGRRRDSLRRRFLTSPVATGLTAVALGGIPLILVEADRFSGEELRNAMTFVLTFDTASLGPRGLRRELYPGEIEIIEEWERVAKDALNITARGWRAEKLDLRGRDLRYADMSNSEMISADFRGADLRGANLAGSNLEGARFGPLERNGRLRVTRLQGANLREARMLGADFTRADLTDAILGDADLSAATMKGARLDGVNGDSIRLIATDLRDASLVAADLVNADARAANFEGADMLLARLVGARLDFSTFSVLTEGVDLRGASLRGVTAVGFRGVNARGATVDSAVMGANLWLTDIRDLEVDWNGTSLARERMVVDLEEIAAVIQSSSSVKDAQLRVLDYITVARCSPRRHLTLGGEGLPLDARCEGVFVDVIDQEYFFEQLATLLVELSALSDHACQGVRLRADAERQPVDLDLSEAIKRIWSVKECSK